MAESPAAASPANKHHLLVLIDLLAPPALYPDESLDDYKAFQVKVFEAIGVQDLVEALLTRDFVERQWDVNRARRFRAAYLKSSMRSGLSGLLFEMRHEDAEEMASGWEIGDSESVEEVKQILGEAGYDRDVIAARAVMDHHATFDYFDRLIDHAETRRDQILREIDRRRSDLARRAREVIPAIEDAEYEDLTVKADS